MRQMAKRWSTWMVGGLVCTALLATPAWADGDEKAPKKKVKPKGADGEIVRQEVACMIDGLSAEQIEKALALLKEHHPKVEAKSREGALKLWSTDGQAFEAALGDLQKLGVPTGDVMIHRPGGAKKDGPKGAPRATDYDQIIAALEKKLAALRENGDAEKVALVERHLDEVRAARKAAAAQGPQEKGGMNLEQARKRLDEARRAFEEAQRGAPGATPGPHFDKEAMEEMQQAAMRRYLEEMSRPEGAPGRGPGGPGPRGPQARGPRAAGPGPQGRGPGGPGGPGARAFGAGEPGAMAPLHERMRHTRQALEHLEAAGLTEQAARTRQALERMERAARDQGAQGGPPVFEVRRMEVGPGLRVGPRPPHAQPPMPPQPPAPPMHAAHGGMRRGPGAELHTLPEGPPPSVGGVRRGTIHQRPHLQGAPPAPPMPPPAPFQQRRHMGPASVTTFGQQGPGTPGGRRWFASSDGSVTQMEEEEAIVIVESAGGPADTKTFVLGGPDSRQVRVLRRDGAPAGPSVRRETEFPRPAPRAAAAGTGAGDAGPQVEALRREMDELRKQLAELLKQLERR